MISEKEPPYLKKSPILIIDDEVDNASVDTGNQYYDENDNPNEEYNPKTINRLIRQLLHIHSKKAFVGYTATPFSNIYIHEDGFTKNMAPISFPKVLFMISQFQVIILVSRSFTKIKMNILLRTNLLNLLKIIVMIFLISTVRVVGYRQNMKKIMILFWKQG